MQKLTAFLEKYVEYVALALGGLFLLYMLFSYLPVLSTPNSVALGGGGEPATPGDVNPRVRETARGLEQKLRNAGGAGAVRIDVPNLGAPLAARLDPPAPQALARGAFVGTPVNVDTESPGDVAVQPGAVVANLPTVPAPELVEARAGLAQVSSAPAADGGGNAPAADPAAAAKDLPWVKVTFTIDPAGVARAFTQAGLPQNFQNTHVVAVELTRERLLPDGTWGDPAPVPPAAVQGVLPAPADAASLNAKLQQADWARTNQAKLLQPEFYKVASGDDPLARPVDLAARAAPNPGEAAANDTRPELTQADLAALPPAERQAVLAARQRAARERNRTNGNAAPTNTRVVPIDGYHALPPLDETLALAGLVAQQQPPRPPQPRPVTGQPNLPPVQPTVAPPAAPAQPYDYPDPPAGQWTLGQLEGPVTAWTYDETVVPGQTYRYQVRYKLLNPTFNARNAPVDKKLTEVFALVGEDKDAWTEAITVPTLVNFYLNGPQPSPTTGAASFQVFRWQDGRRHAADVIARPGDPIGTTRAGVDFTTGFTVADVRTEAGGKTYVLVMNADGSTLRREFATDQADPQRQRFAAEAGAQASAGG